MRKNSPVDITHFPILKQAVDIVIFKLSPIKNQFFFFFPNVVGVAAVNCNFFFLFLLKWKWHVGADCYYQSCCGLLPVMLHGVVVTLMLFSFSLLLLLFRLLVLVLLLQYDISSKIVLSIDICEICNFCSFLLLLLFFAVVFFVSCFVSAI